MRKNSSRIQQVATMASILVAAAAIILFSVMHVIDLGRQPGAPGFLQYILEPDPATARYTLTAIATTLATLVAITITLVLIVVQMTANRYTPKLIDLFAASRVNVLLLGAFIFTVIYCFYVAHTIKPDYAPTTGILVCFVLMTACLVSLIPYLFFVFDFLQPNNIISKIQSRAIASLQPSGRSRGTHRATKLRFSQSLEQITDIANGSLRMNDSSVALSSIWALQDISARYLGEKPRQSDQWFTVERGIFLGPSREYVSLIENEREWVEVKILRQLHTILGGAMEGFGGVATAVAVSARHIGEQGLESGDQSVIELVVKYFNTFLREAINARQKRVIYNVLDQYRRLAEELIVPWPELALRISHHLCYYARLAEEQGLTFIAETVAYDLKVLNQVAYQQKCPRASDILGSLVSLAHVLQRRGHQRALPGVHKMWLALAAFYLSEGADSLQEQLEEVLRRVDQEELVRLGKEVLSVTQPDFWEITDRGVNFDYLEPDLRPYLREVLERLGEPE